MLLITASIPFHLDWLVIPPHHYHGIILHLQWYPVFVLPVALQHFPLSSIQGGTAAFPPIINSCYPLAAAPLQRVRQQQNPLDRSFDTRAAGFQVCFHCTIPATKAASPRPCPVVQRLAPVMFCSFRISSLRSASLHEQPLVKRRVFITRLRAGLVIRRAVVAASLRLRAGRAFVARPRPALPPGARRAL